MDRSSEFVSDRQLQGKRSPMAVSSSGGGAIASCEPVCRPTSARRVTVAGPFGFNLVSPGHRGSTVRIHGRLPGFATDRRKRLSEGLQGDRGRVARLAGHSPRDCRSVKPSDSPIADLDPHARLTNRSLPRTRGSIRSTALRFAALRPAGSADGQPARMNRGHAGGPERLVLASRRTLRAGGVFVYVEHDRVQDRGHDQR